MWPIVQKGVLPVLVVLLLGACVARGLDVGLIADELVLVKDPTTKP